MEMPLRVIVDGSTPRLEAVEAMKFAASAAASGSDAISAGVRKQSAKASGVPRAARYAAST